MMPIASGRFQCRYNRSILVGGTSLILALLVSLLLRCLRPMAVPFPGAHQHNGSTDADVQADIAFIPIQSNATAASIEMKILPGLGGSTPMHGRWDGYAAIITMPTRSEVSKTQNHQSIFSVLGPIGGCASDSGHLSKTSANAQQNDCDVGVNGSPFNRGGGCIGQSISNGRPVCQDCSLWAGIPSIGLSTANASSVGNGMTGAKWIIGTGVNYSLAESMGIYNLLVGHVPGWLIRQGIVQIPANHSDRTLAPRTAVGITADGSRLILLVVDGCEHCPGFMGGAKGLSVYELAMEMTKLGAAFALNLDGGGSSTMFAKGTGIVNYPVSFDYAPIYHERPVSTMLCIRL